RTIESAKLVFGRATKTDDVRGGPVAPENPARYAALRKLLSAKVKRGENRAISSHANPFYALTGPPYLAEGEIAVVRPLGSGRFHVVARAPSETWGSFHGFCSRGSGTGTLRIIASVAEAPATPPRIQTRANPRPKSNPVR